jgi:hypothetical protein
MYKLSLIAISSIYSCFAFAQESQICYWPKGGKLTTKDNYTACANEGTSQCCVEGHACLSNGLCFNPTKGSVNHWAICVENTADHEA